MYTVNNYKNIVLYVLLCMFCISCVPLKQYEKIKNDNDRFIKEREELISENEKLTVENTELKSILESIENDKAKLADNEKSAASQLKQLQEENNNLKTRYEDLNKTYQSLLSGSDNETRQLMQKLENSHEELYQQEDELKKLALKIENDKIELANLKKELESRKSKLVELENIVQKKDKALDDIREKVSTALTGYENKGLTITRKNSKIYVSLEEKLLFKSGSSNVDDKGKEALKKLGSVLEQNPDINITIEGHTDDVPVLPGSAVKDNWDLSVQRATAIVRILLENSQINPKRLIASGRSKYIPVDNTKTDEARQKNRRTEIILTPDLKEIFQIIDN